MAEDGEVGHVIGEGGARLGGQRNSIARALVHEPRVLAVDEATASLHQQTGLEILRTLRQATYLVTIFTIY